LENEHLVERERNEEGNVKLMLLNANYEDEWQMKLTEVGVQWWALLLAALIFRSLLTDS
jgi:hypothetical protein